MVCWAAALAEQAKTAAKPNSTAPAYLRTFVLEILVLESPLARLK